VVATAALLWPRAAAHASAVKGGAAAGAIFVSATGASVTMALTLCSASAASSKPDFSFWGAQELFLILCAGASENAVSRQSLVEPSADSTSSNDSSPPSRRQEALCCSSSSSTTASSSVSSDFQPRSSSGG